MSDLNVTQRSTSPDGRGSMDMEDVGADDVPPTDGEFNRSSAYKMAEKVPLWETIVFTTTISVCICITLIGNVLVILSVFTYRPLRNVQNFYIVSLACADLAVTLLVMPFNVVNFIVGLWLFGAILCNIWLTFDILTCTASILHLCAIAIDRFSAINSPIEYAQKRTLKRVLAGIAIVWGVSALISVPPLIGWNNTGGNSLYNARDQSCKLTDERGYVLYSAAGSFFIPLVIMTFVYVKIFTAARRRLRARASGAALFVAASNTQAPQPQPPSPLIQSQVPSAAEVDLLSTTRTPAEEEEEGPGEDRPGKTTDDAASTSFLKAPVSLQRSGTPVSGSMQEISQYLEEKQRISLTKERRVARTMAIIMGAFVVCWMPFFFMYVIFPFCGDLCSSGTDRRLVNFFVWLGYINSTLNPIIYTVFNVDFRRAFKALLLHGKCKRNVR